MVYRMMYTLMIQTKNIGPTSVMEETRY